MGPRILVPVDGTELAERVIYRVEADIQMKPGNAEIVICNVRVPDVDEHERGEMTGKLIRQVLTATTRGVRCRLEQVDADTVPEGICEIAEREQIDLIAMYTGSSRPPGERTQGSYSRMVSEDADCEVRVLDAHLKPGRC
ncbi:MAG: universal stress protein [Dehalococcoidia bacterium]|jgi:nucleotide-binding universal stress UspA family protein|nr:universal stress protein [Dehalococcoidia bacterium]